MRFGDNGWRLQLALLPEGGCKVLSAIEFKPRLQQMRQFIEACTSEPTAKRRDVFKTLFDLDDSTVDFLLFNGMLSPESPLNDLYSSLNQMESEGVEQFVRGILVELSNHYPSGQTLRVELFPMDDNDQFGRRHLGGVSAWTNWEGDTVHLVVHPSKGTVHALRSTVVHEYNHHYRITALNNGHPRVTVLEKIVREGLAEHFVADTLGADFLGPWAKSLTEEDAKMYWNTLYFDHALECGDETDSLVFGGGRTDIPLWAGYSMGYHLVKWYRQLHPLVSAVQLSTLDSEKFVPTSLNF